MKRVPSRTIQRAVIHDLQSILSLIRARIEWMNENNIKQWNRTDYLSRFTNEYFHRVISNGQLYTVKTDGQVIGAFTLFDYDERWNDGQKALYIHNFVSDIHHRGVGDDILCFCENEARKKNIFLLRIDCQKDNKKLNDYYSRRGFKYISSFEEELYCGNRRQKRIP